MTQPPPPSSPSPRDPREQTGGPPIWSIALAVLGGILLIGFIAYAVVVGDAKQLEPAGIGAGVLGAALFAGWLYLEREGLRRASATQGARFTSGALLITLMGLGIAVALNVIANRYDDRYDLTSTGLFTLSPQTQEVVAGLTEDVEVIAFFSSGSEDEIDFRTRIEGYTALSSHMTVSFKDPIRSPLLTEQYQITSQWGTVILKQGERTQRLESEFTEEALTNALVRLTAGTVHGLCFVTGHEELDATDTYDPMALGGISARLEAENYTARTVTLFREGRVPADCAVLIVADPRQDWLPAEQEMLATYLVGGGNLLLMMEPGSAPALATHMQRYGIDIGDNLVLEAGANAQLFNGDISYVLLTPDAFDFHPISKAVKGYTLHRVARTVGKGDPVEGINVQELAHTTESSWAKTDLANLTDVNPDPTQDRMGPLSIITVAEIVDPTSIPVYATASAPSDAGRAPIALPGAETPEAPEAPAAEAPEAPAAEAPEVPAAEAPEAPAPVLEAGAEVAVVAPQPLEVSRAAGGRLAVFGDVDFATNGLAGSGGNMDLFLNTVAWLVGEEDQISIRPNEAAEATVSMNLIQGLLVWLICLVVAPGMALLGALGTWRRRRQR